MNKTKLVQVEIEGRSSFSGAPVKFKEWIEPSLIKNLKEETSGLEKDFSVKKTGKFKRTHFGWYYKFLGKHTIC